MPGMEHTGTQVRCARRCGRMRTALLMGLLTSTACLLPACMPSTVVPMATRLISDGYRTGTRDLIVYLPGKGDDARSFETRGLLADLREHGLTHDILACEAHIGYYADQSIVERVAEDAIEPARMLGYERIWLVGNSMGGTGALLYAWRNPDEIAGVVLLGPFISSEGVVEEIKLAGGIAAWTTDDIDSLDWERHVWSWLKEYRKSEGRGYPRIYLGYGRGDWLSGHDVLASLLPGDCVAARHGGHSWAVWRDAWRDLLDKGALRAPAKERSPGDDATEDGRIRYAAEEPNH
jgi:pimeloyl-ACP methyl ester carboxylesterase